MSALGVAVIYVSHRMEEIRRIASRATVMRDGQVAGDVMPKTPPRIICVANARARSR
ncbi:hypothetical protein ACNKHX_15650 [Shigella flexneri]